MYLKKIIVCGFKSFVDRTSLTLEKDRISGIVGPNGSGKSNIIDAVRWVMGEQNTKLLRGEKATDIIFSGSKGRKPVGMAEVTLVFDNGESSTFCPPEYRHELEIGLTRRLYSNGEREYLINKKQCRLKDMIDFFVSSGLGGKSYSMIQQGQVDRILQAKPEELREIVEEASGTASYKKRRNDALKKLEDTRISLSRIDDILKELDRQLVGLQEHVDKANKWKELSNEIREKEIHFLSQSYFFSKTHKKSLESELSSFDKVESENLSRIAKFEAEHQILQNKLDEADPEIRALSEKIAVAREQFATKETTLANTRSRLEEWGHRVYSLRQEVDEDGQRVSLLKKQVKDAESLLQMAEEKAKELQEFFETYEHHLEIMEEKISVYENNIQDFQEESSQVLRLIDSNKIRLESLNRDYTEIARKKDEFTQKVIKLEDDYSRAAIIVDSFEVKLSKGRKDVEKLTEKKKNVAKELEEQFQEEENGRIAQHECREELSRTKVKITSLLELEKSSDLRASLELLNEALKNKLFLLCDALKIKESDVARDFKALSLFEKWSERVVIEHVDDIAKLSDVVQKTGLPGLPAVVVGELQKEDQNTLDLWANINGLISLRKFVEPLSADKYGVDSLLSRMFYAPHKELSPTILQGAPLGVVVFCGSQTVLSSSFELWISPRDVQSSLARRRMIEHEESLLAETTKKLENIEQTLKTISEVRTQNLNTSKDLEKEIDALHRVLLQDMGHLQEAKIKSKKCHDEIIYFRKEYGLIDEKAESLLQSLDDIKISNERMLTERAHLLENIRSSKDELDALYDEKEELQRANEDRKMEYVAANERWKTISENYASQKEQAESFDKKYLKRKEEFEGLQLVISDGTNLCKNLEEEIKEIFLVREEAEQRLNAKRDENKELVELTRKYEKNLQEERIQKDKIQKNKSEKLLELEKIKISSENFEVEAREKYKVELLEMPISHDESFKPSTFMQRITKLRNSLEELGAINMVAIEEQTELLTRRDFIFKQKEEVCESIALLDHAIKEIEGQAERKFLDTYDVLSREFKAIFPLLFPGGEGLLNLTAPETPLESGVEILVLLPGKSRQNMRLFSGGEKALTAIALIFALLKSKPTPFCFLDEVDAALDETNVARYNDLLEALSDKFQFIVITHRRKTMEVLDMLYGITMQEPGVSKLVSVDLTKALPTHLKKALHEPSSHEEKEVKRSGAVAHL